MCVYSLRPQHFRTVGSLSKIFFDSSFDLNNGKKEVREEEKSSSTVGLFVILDNVSSSRSWSAEK